MAIDLDPGDRERQPARTLVGAVLLLALMALGACSETLNYARDGRAINLRDCSDWRTNSIPGCYDGQGGNGRN